MNNQALYFFVGGSVSVLAGLIWTIWGLFVRFDSAGRACSGVAFFTSFLVLLYYIGLGCLCSYCCVTALRRPQEEAKPLNDIEE